MTPSPLEGVAIQGTGRRDIQESEPPHRPAAPALVAQAPAPVRSPISERHLLMILGGVLGVLLAGFTTWGPARIEARHDRVPASPVAVKEAQAAARYAPENVVVARGRDKGELTVSWTMPTRPDVIATVIYEGAGVGKAPKARTIVNYGTGSEAAPRATLHGLTGGQQICLSAVHLVSLGGSVTNAASRPVCAVPR